MAETAPKSIIADPVLHETAIKLRKTCDSQFGVLLWCHPTTKRKTAICMHKYIPLGAQQPQRYVRKFTFCM